MEPTDGRADGDPRSALRVRLVYPPHGYYFMPYLAPYLLAGHLREATNHEVSVEDLNIEFHRHLWSGAVDDELLDELDAGASRSTVVLADAVRQFGETSWRALRCDATYGSVEDVRFHARVLAEGARMATVSNRIRGARRVLPDRIGGWAELLDVWERTLLGRFLAHEVAAGRYDSHDVIGLSAAYVPQVVAALLLARLVKRRRPAVTVVVGGGGATHLLTELRTDPSWWEAVDAVIPYEGEVTLTAALDALARGRPLSALHNIVVPDPSGERVTVYRQDLMGRPVVHGTPDFSDLAHHYPTPRVIYPLLTSKGCYWGKCAFCTHHEGYAQGYSRAPDALFEASLTTLIDQGAREFYFVDEALPPRKFRDLVEIFAEHGRDGPPPGWMAEARLERSMVDGPAVDRLVQSGCRLLVNGIESGCQEVVDRMRKGIDLDLVARHARLCAERGIQTGWMFFVGFPGETPAQAAETFAFIEANADAVDYASVGVFQLERDCPIWHDPEAFGVADILGSDQPYRLSFHYRDAGGVLHDGSGAEAHLRQLHQAHPHLRPLFADAVDRALAYFLPARLRTGPGEPPRSATWTSPHLGGVVRWDMGSGRAHVAHRPGQAVG